MTWLAAACTTIAAFAATLALSAQHAPAATPVAKEASLCMWRCPASGRLFPKLPQCSANCITACEPPPCQ